MTPDKPLPCPTCAKLTLWQKLFGRDIERVGDLREAAQQHVKFHAAGLAKGEVSREVKEIAEANR